MGDVIMKTKKRNQGFTLVEILIVVVILGILAAIVIPQFSQASTEARESSLASNLQSIRSQIELYKIQHNDNPPSFANFVAQMTGKTDQDGTVNANGAFGPYLQNKVPNNPFTGTNTLDQSGTAGDDGGAWEYDESNGEFYADDSGICADGVTAHSAM